MSSGLVPDPLFDCIDFDTVEEVGFGGRPTGGVRYFLKETRRTSVANVLSFRSSVTLALLSPSSIVESSDYILKSASSDCTSLSTFLDRSMT